MITPVYLSSETDLAELLLIFLSYAGRAEESSKGVSERFLRMACEVGGDARIGDSLLTRRNAPIKMIRCLLADSPGPC